MRWRPTSAPTTRSTRGRPVAELRFSPFQGRVLAVPEGMDLCLDGGRGGAKSHAMALMALRRSEEHGAASRILYVRRTYKGLADFEAITREVFGHVYGPAARYNASEPAWRLDRKGTR